MIFFSRFFSIFNHYVGNMKKLKMSPTSFRKRYFLMIWPIIDKKDITSKSNHSHYIKMLIDGQNGFILKERDIVKENPFIDFSAIKLNLHIICTCQYLYRTVWLVSPLFLSVYRSSCQFRHVKIVQLISNLIHFL